MMLIMLFHVVWFVNVQHGEVQLFPGAYVHGCIGVLCYSVPVSPAFVTGGSIAAMTQLMWGVANNKNGHFHFLAM